MLRVAVSGIAKLEIARAVQGAGGDRVVVAVLSDFEAAKAVKEGRADVMIGSCATGQGGALAMAIALLGRERCLPVASAGRAPRVEEVRAKAATGAVAFGVVPEAVEAVIPALVETLLAR